MGSDLRSGTRAQLGTSSQADFASILGIQNRVANSAGNGAGAEDARKVAEEFVAKVFIEPVFKQMRESNQTPPPFGPGQGEKQFSSLIDAQRALELVRSASWPIVDRLAADMTRKPAAGSPVAGEKAIGTNDIDIRKSVPASDTPAQLGFSALRG